MRYTSIQKYHELMIFFCSHCIQRRCTETMYLKCIAACLLLASTYSDILEEHDEMD